MSTNNGSKVIESRAFDFMKKKTGFICFFNYIIKSVLMIMRELRMGMGK